MASEYAKNVGDYLSPADAAKVAGQRAGIERIADSADGTKVKELLDRSGVDLAGALERGDAAALEGALRSILSTGEGSRVLDEISKMIK